MIFLIKAFLIFLIIRTHYDYLYFVMIFNHFMKVAFLGDALDLQYAGIHVYTRELLKAIHALDRKNEYVIVRPYPKNEFEGWEELVIPVNKSIPMHERIRQFYHIPKSLRKLGVDIVVEPGHFGPFNLPGAIKRITVIHDLTPLLLPHFHIKNSQIAHQLFLPRILKRAAHVITNSEYTRKDLIEYSPQAASKSTAILLGKDPIFKPDQKAAILKKYKLPKEYILFVGTLEPRKNLMVLLKAFEQLVKAKGSDTKLVLVGKKGWRIDSFMEALATSSARDHVILPGFVETADLPALYTMAKVFVYPSLYEGFGLPILEAMACGTPVITSAISSLPEVGGDAALYFDPSSFEALGALLIKLLSDETQQKLLSEKGLERAKQFTWESTAKETVEVFEKVMRTN